MKLNYDDTANILAALRFWQARQPAMSRRRAAEHFGDGDFDAYDDEEIDELCERINTEEDA